MTTEANSSVCQIAEWLSLIAGDTNAIELRAPDSRPPGCAESTNVVRRFCPGDFEAAARNAIRISEHAPAVFHVLNGIKPALFTAIGGASATDIPSRRWLLVDCDPVRPSNTSSTAAEKARAIALAESICSAMQEIGWPEPILADSGNGAHLLYRIELPTEDDGLVKAVLVALAERHDTPECQVDRVVYDPPRLVKLYGTRAKKGESTQERPHRDTRVLRVPAEIVPVPVEMLQALAQEAKSEAKPKPVIRAVAPVEPPWSIPVTNGELSAEDRAILYLKKVDPSISGQHGHNAAIKAACNVGPGFDLPPETLFRLLTTYFNPLCQPEWSEKEIRHKVDQAYKKEKRRGWLLNAERNGHSVAPKVISEPLGRLPLYRLSELAGASRIYFLKDEKAADLAWGLGVTATTTAQEQPSYKTDVRPLAGRDIVIISSVGEARTAALVNLIGGLNPQPTVRVVRLPGLVDDGDGLEKWLETVPDSWEPDQCRTELERLANICPLEKLTHNGTIAANGQASDGKSCWRLDARKASGYQIRPVKYLSKPRLPRGMIVLVAGLGGEGKSTLFEDTAARASVGKPMLGATEATVGPIDVLMLANEDGKEDSLVPRLLAAGADMDRVELVEGLINEKGERTPFDVTYAPYLRSYILEGRERGRDFRLVTIDPITTYVGRAKIDDHRDAELKPALERLSSVAQELDVTFLCSAHLNKSTGTKSAVFRVMGGAAYVTSSRLAYAYGADPDAPGRKILACSKANVPGGKPPSLVVGFAPIPTDEALRVIGPHAAHLSDEDCLELAGQLSRVSYEGASEMNADELLGGGDTKDKECGRAEKARDFLVEMLADGKQVASNDIVAAGKKRGISRSAIWDAKKTIDITSCKVTGNGQTAWYWTLNQCPDFF